MTPLSELNLETAVPANLHEWLRGYFDGGAHAVGGHVGVVFPVADLAFGVGQPRTPLAGHAGDQPGLEIRVVTLNVARDGAWQSAYDAPTWTGKLAEDRVLWQFQVRAKLGKMEESQYATAQAGQLLHAILNNPLARAPLTVVGLGHLAARKPEILPTADYALRVVYCEARLTYPILLGPSTANPVLHDASGNTYTLGVVSDGGAAQLTLTAAATPAPNVVLRDEAGNAYEISVVQDAGAAQLVPLPGADPTTAREYVDLQDASGNRFRVRLVTDAGAPQAEVEPLFDPLANPVLLDARGHAYTLGVVTDAGVPQFTLSTAAAPPPDVVLQDAAGQCHGLAVDDATGALVLVPAAGPGVASVELSAADGRRFRVAVQLSSGQPQLEITQRTQL